MCVYLWLIHVGAWQKPTQYYKQLSSKKVIFFLKGNRKKKRESDMERASSQPEASNLRIPAPPTLDTLTWNLQAASTGPANGLPLTTSRP